MKTIADHVRQALGQSGKVMRPVGHARSLRHFNKGFRLGRQEDAHEFLRCLLDALQEACIKGIRPRPPVPVQMSTWVSRMFGGMLCSEVKCLSCGHPSRKRDPCMDISLEINRAGSLQRALEQFTAPEYLEGDNAYKCEKCNKRVRAQKRFTIEQLPRVLTFHLKRFEFGGFGSKINRMVDYPETIDMASYVEDGNGPPQRYHLYGVLVHWGGGVHSGHYFSYVKGPNGIWYRCDDCHVGPCDVRQALSQKAYLLFYQREDAQPHVSQYLMADGFQATRRAGAGKAQGDDDTGGKNGRGGAGGAAGGNSQAPGLLQPAPVARAVATPQTPLPPQGANGPSLGATDRSTASERARPFLGGLSSPDGGTATTTFGSTEAHGSRLGLGEQSGQESLERSRAGGASADGAHPAFDVSTRAAFSTALFAGSWTRSGGRVRRMLSTGVQLVSPQTVERVRLFKLAQKAKRLGGRDKLTALENMFVDTATRKWKALGALEEAKIKAQATAAAVSSVTSKERKRSTPSAMLTTTATGAIGSPGVLRGEDEPGATTMATGRAAVSLMRRSKLGEVEGWDAGIGSDAKWEQHKLQRAVDAHTKGAGVKRTRDYDEYDADYDAGKVKKVRAKKEEVGGVDSGKLDEVWRERKDGISRVFDERGNRLERQDDPGAGRGRGRGRGRDSGGRGFVGRAGGRGWGGRDGSPGRGRGGREGGYGGRGGFRGGSQGRRDSADRGRGGGFGGRGRGGSPGGARGGGRFGGRGGGVGDRGGGRGMGGRGRGERGSSHRGWR